MGDDTDELQARLLELCDPRRPHQVVPYDGCEYDVWHLGRSWRYRSRGQDPNLDRQLDREALSRDEAYERFKDAVHAATDAGRGGHMPNCLKLVAAWARRLADRIKRETTIQRQACGVDRIKLAFHTCYIVLDRCLIDLTGSKAKLNADR